MQMHMQQRSLSSHDGHARQLGAGASAPVKRNALAMLVLLAATSPAFAADWWTTLPPPPTHGPTVIEVRDMGAKGDGVTDDTAAFQRAIDALPASEGGAVHVSPGRYMIDATAVTCPGANAGTHECGIILRRSHMKLSMDVGAVLAVIPNDQGHYNLLYVKGQNNIEIRGGRIVGDRVKHIDTGGATGQNEQGMGIRIGASTNILVDWTEASNFWGDGIVIGGGSDYVRLDQVKSTSNRRQGLTIGAAQHVLVTNSTFADTNGTAPQDGVDIEPDPGFGDAQNIRFSNNTMTGNFGNGLEVHSSNTADYPPNVSNLTLVNNTMDQNHGYGVILQNLEFAPQVSSNDFTNNGGAGLYLSGITHDAVITDNTMTGNSTQYWCSDTYSGPRRDMCIGPKTYNIQLSGNVYTGN